VSPDDLVLDVRDLTVEYRGERTVRAVTELSVAIRRGETVALIGESGSGKTTAALAILGMLPDSAHVLGGGATVLTGTGPIDLIGLAPRELRVLRWRHIAYVPQGSINALNPVQRISRHFQQTAHAHGLAADEAQARAFELLEAVHLDAPRIWGSYPHELSGGTRQRVAIALAMLLRPAVIVLDEPTTALDVLTQEAVLRTLLDLQAQTGVSYLMITHDLAMAGAMADRIVTMVAGRAVEYGDSASVLADPRHSYTRGLLAAMPSLDGDDAMPPTSAVPSVAAITEAGMAGPLVDIATGRAAEPPLTGRIVREEAPA